MIKWIMSRSSPASVSTQKVLAFFLVAWWAVAAGINTSVDGAFSSPMIANGYFATWTGFIASMFHFARYWNA